MPLVERLFFFDFRHVHPNNDIIRHMLFQKNTVPRVRGANPQTKIYI